MTLLKKIFKRKHIITQSVCNHPKLEYYYQANNPKRKNGHIKGKVVYDLYCICKCCKCRKLISKNKVAHGVIQWKECSCMKDVRLEDVTPELEEKALNEIKNNN